MKVVVRWGRVGWGVEDRGDRGEVDDCCNYYNRRVNLCYTSFTLYAVNRLLDYMYIFND